MSYYDDMERCDHCLARLRPGGCTRWGTEVAPCEREYEEEDGEDEEEDEEEDEQDADR